MTRKIFLLLLTALMFVLFLFGCTGPATSHTEKSSYNVGEVITVFDNETNYALGSVTITDVSVVKDTPFEIAEYDGEDKNGQAKYKYVSYEAVVQISYTYTAVDSSVKMDSRNFKVTDHKGKSTEVSPDTPYDTIPTNDHYFCVAVKNKGDYVLIDFRFNKRQEYITTITGFYNKNNYATPSTDNSQTDTNQNTHYYPEKSSGVNEKEYLEEISRLKFYCMLELLIIILLVIFFVIIPHRKKKKAMKQQAPSPLINP